MFMSGKDFRESLRACKSSVYVNGRKVKSVASDTALAPGITGIVTGARQMVPLPRASAVRRKPKAAARKPVNKEFGTAR